MFFFFLEDCISIKVALRPAFAASHRFWVVEFSLSFVSRIFFYFLFDFFSNLLLRNVLLNLHVFVFLVVFFLYLISSLTALWSDKMLDTISIFLNLLRFDLWPKMWSLLDNVPHALEKKVYSSSFGWNVLKISVRFISSNVSFKTCVSLIIFCFVDMSIGVSGVLNSPTIIVLLSVSPFLSIFFILSIYLMYWGAPMLGV